MKSKNEAAGIQSKERETVPDTESPLQSEGKPSHEEIQQRAYEIYLERSRTNGEDLGDWLQAELELKAKYRVG